MTDPRTLPALPSEAERPRCAGCNQEIDPDCCGCGEPRQQHGVCDGHPFIPMGCDCHREPPRAVSDGEIARIVSMTSAEARAASGLTDQQIDDMAHRMRCLVERGSRDCICEEYAAVTGLLHPDCPQHGYATHGGE